MILVRLIIFLLSMHVNVYTYTRVFAVSRVSYNRSFPSMMRVRHVKTARARAAWAAAFNLLTPAGRYFPLHFVPLPAAVANSPL